MKPSVISNGNGNGNPQLQQQQQQHQQPHHPQQQPHHQYSTQNPGTGVSPGTNSHYSPQQSEPASGYIRTHLPHHFPQGFGFDQDMDDMFSDARIRSRLPRMRDPFGTFGTHDTDDFFSGFGTRRRNPHDFFDFPDEFRQYIPEGFGIPRSGSGGSSRAHQVHPTYQPTANEQQVYPNEAHYTQNVPQSPKPNLCDASIQTDEDLTDGAGGDSPQQTKSSSGPKLNNRYSQENDENRGPRSQSAPPHQIPEMQLKQGSTEEQPAYVATSYSTSAPMQHGNYATSQGTGMTPHPPQRQQQPFYLHHPNQGQARQWPPPTQPSQTNNQTQPTANIPEPQTPGGTVIRTIPIFVEGRKEPVVNDHKEIPGQNTVTPSDDRPPRFPQPQQQQSTQNAQYGKPPSYQKPPTYQNSTRNNAQMPPQSQTPQSQAQQQQQPQSPNKLHPHLDTNQQIPVTSDVPPQTPNTMDCINKIQNIQRDVLHLMEKVEGFKGLKSDKEYMYLDEMLTRNLLKLDTIDTNGKDSIRLARKEAIKCIQASINVLEAKADENTRKTGKFEVRHNSIEEEPNAEEKEQNQTSANEQQQEDTPQILNDQTIIPLPPPPDHTNDIKNENELRKSNSSIKKSGSQTKTEKSTSGNKITEENLTERVPSKSKIPVKGASPTKEVKTSDSTTRVTRSQSKSPSKSPTKSVGVKETAKKKIIKKLKKLTKKDSKDNGDDEIENENEKEATENNQNTEVAKTEETIEINEKKD